MKENYYDDYQARLDNQTKQEVRRQAKTKMDLRSSFSSDWIRFKHYELKETAKGKIYIVPQGNSDFELYNPFECAESLLIDALQLGDLYKTYKKEKNKVENDPYKKRKLKKRHLELKEAALAFSRHYGLLGLMSASVYNQHIIGESHVFITEKNSLGLKPSVMKTDAYMKLFTPFVEEGALRIDYYKDTGYLIKYEDTPRFYGKKPMVMDLIFSSFYSEQLEWLLDFVAMLSDHYNQLQVYKSKEIHLTEPVTIMADIFEATKIGFTIDQSDQTRIAWTFDSLKTTLQTIYGFAVTGDQIKLKRCHYCQNFYFALTTREKYCGAACRNRSNVKKSRQRLKNQGE